MKQLFQSFFFLLLLFSCTRADLEPPVTPEPEPEQVVHTTFRPSWPAGTTAPSALRLHLYRAGETPVVADCPATGYEADLKVGIYRGLCYNIDATNVAFSGMDSYETATVSASATPASRAALASRAEGTEVAQPSGLYHAPVDEFTLEAGKSVELTFSPVALAKTVRLRFELPAWLATESLSGALTGVYPSLLLSTLEPSAEALAASRTTYVAFDAALSGTEAAATVTLFGLANPQGGTAYTNTLTLGLTAAGGRQYPLVADLTSALTEVIAANGGTLPAEVEFVVGLDNMLVPVVTVGDWTPSGNTGMIL